jgi:hypothetical protein
MCRKTFTFPRLSVELCSDRGMKIVQCPNVTGSVLGIYLLDDTFVRVGANKSSARPGRKQAIATKLWIYSTYSPRSSIHFLACCSNFCKPLKKNTQIFPFNNVSAAVITSVSDEKWRHFNSSPRLDVVEIARVARHASFQPL